ncbi:hypothetical protein AB0M50_19095 [Nonomuraea fuscirosea]|uniref:hypothetical protein n=1 Tax=Nonomuraea fuscirosea TaxID=1291556 RepID=UPI003427C6B4
MISDGPCGEISMLRLWAIVLLTAGSLYLLVSGAAAVQRVISGEGLLPIETLEVEPDAVREVSSIGTVVAQTTVDPFYERTVQVSNILIMDVGASSFKEASATARTALEGHGWVKSAEPITDHIYMESPEWAFTSLSIAPIQDLAGWGADVPDSVMKSPRADAYVLIDMTPLQ